MLAKLCTNWRYFIARFLCNILSLLHRTCSCRPVALWMSKMELLVYITVPSLSGWSLIGLFRRLRSPFQPPDRRRQTPLWHGWHQSLMTSRQTTSVCATFIDCFDGLFRRKKLKQLIYRHCRKWCRRYADRRNQQFSLQNVIRSILWNETMLEQGCRHICLGCSSIHVTYIMTVLSYRIGNVSR